MRFVIKTAPEKVKKIPKYTYISLFFLMYLSSGFGMSVISGTMILTLDLLLCGYLCIMRPKINPSRFGIPIICLTFALVSFFVNGEPAKQVLILMSFFVLSIVYCNANDWDDTCEAYVKIVYVICVASIILYVIDIFAPELLKMLPKVSNENIQLSTVLFAVSPRDNRNYGMFWEPGAFQTYILIAFIIEVLHFNAKNKKRLTMMIIALATTFSTAGYIAMAIAIIAILMSGMTDNVIKKTTRNTIIIILIGAIVAYFIINNYNPQLKNTLYGKIELYGETRKDDTSTGVRVNAIVDAFKVFFEHPVFGVGKTKLKSIFDSKYGHELVTCTYANWFAYFGVFVGAAMISGIYKFTAYFSRKTIVRFIIFIALMASITSEDYVMNPSILIWIFYGFDTARNKIIAEKGRKE